MDILSTKTDDTFTKLQICDYECKRDDAMFRIVRNKGNVRELFMNLREDDFPACYLIMRLNAKEKCVIPSQYSALFYDFFENDSDIDLKNIEITIDEKIDLISKTFLERRMQKGKRFYEFGKGFFDKEIWDEFQRKSKVKSIITFPLISFYKKTIGVVLFGYEKKKKMNELDYIDVLGRLARKIGPFTGEIVIGDRHKTDFEDKIKRLKNGEKVEEVAVPNPSVKFTLRITKDIEEYIKWKAKKAKVSKAKLLRKYIEEDLMNKDEDYWERDRRE